MSISVLIVDDEQIARKRILTLLEDYHEPFDIQETADVIAASQIVQLSKPNIIFLDIKMPKFSGFDFIRMNDLRSSKVIFQTAYSEYAAKAYEVEAENYLLKPFSKERFYNVLKKTLDTLRQRDNSKNLKSILVKIGQREKMIDIKDVLYFSTINHSTFLALKDRTFFCSFSLQELEENLNSANFIRVHRNTLLNASYVESWSNTYPMVIHLKNGETLKVSKERRRKVREFFANV